MANLTNINVPIQAPRNARNTTPARNLTAFVNFISSAFMQQWLSNKMDPTDCTPSLGLEGCQITVNYTNATLNDTGVWITAEATVQPFIPPFPPWLSVIIGILLGLVTCVTVSGNVLVLLAFIVDSKIRIASNYFIASLATTDLLIGTVSLPLFTDYVLMGHWHLGPFLCDLWLWVDYTACLASQYNVLLITIDRYCSVKIAAKYRAWRTKKKVLFLISLTWIIPSVLFFTTIFGWEYFIGYRDLEENECAVQFLKDPIINTALIIGYFWTTLIVMTYLYVGIFLTAYEMHKKSVAKQRKMQSMVALSAGAMSGMAGRAAGISGINKATISSEKQDKMSVTFTLSKGSLAAPLQTLGTSTDSNSSQKSSANRSNATATGTSTTTTVTIECNDDKRERLNEIERSISPAFDSDEDGSPVMTAKNRPSVANLIVKKETLKLLNNMRINGGISEAYVVKSIPTSHGETEKAKNCLSRISENSNGFPEIQTSNTQSQNSVFQACVTSPTSSGIATPSEQKDISIVTTVAQRIVSPPTDFKGSPPVSESPSSMSDSSRARTLRILRDDGSTYDILVNVDGSDLRYMEESSIIITSPPLESPPSSITTTIPLGTDPSSPPTLNSGTFPSTSLLQAALIRATEVKSQPIAKTPSLARKLNTEVSIVAGEKLEPVITVVSVFPRANEQVQSLSKSDGNRSALTLKPVSSPGIENSEVSSPGVSSVADKSDKVKKHFLKSLGKKLKGKTFKKGVLSEPDSQVRTKSENRARKAFRTISLILGVFVLCWTPYHVLALVEGFCKTPPCINMHLYMFSYFLCYANSPINPFCYALANQQFRKTFARLLRGDFHMT